MHSKKGVVEIQFNWIFTIIAGAIIIILFTTIILKQKESSETAANLMIIKNLDVIWSGSETTIGTVNIIKIPKTKIEFRCNGYSIWNSPKQLNTMNVFVPSVLDGDRIISTTLGWGIPYRATNLVYLTNPKIRYIFIAEDDNEFANKIYDMVPDEIRKNKYTSAALIKDENDDEVRIVFFDQEPAVTNNLKGIKKVTALKIVGDKDKGTVEFFGLVNDIFVSKETSYYIKEETLLGAIFTDDKEIYDCAMKSAFKKLNIVSQVYEGRVNELTAIKPNCIYGTSQIRSILDASEEFSKSNIDIIDIAAKNLEEQNKNLQKKSCPLIY